MPAEEFEKIVTRLGLRYCEGLQAISRKEKNLITAKDTRKILGSVNLDEDLCKSLPNANRWDYMVAYSVKTKTLYFIEIHSVKNRDKIKDVIAKKKWLDEYLDSEGQALKTFAKKFLFYWVAPNGFVPRKGSAVHHLIARVPGVRGPVAKLELGSENQ